MQDYLQDSLQNMEGADRDKERHPAYQKMVRLINELMKEHNITAPAGIQGVEQ